jgi:tetratricopeptide (TPR) repeat protein
MDNKAQFLEKLGKDAEAAAAMKIALAAPGTTSLEIHTYGRRLLTAGKKEEALKVFQLNAERNGDAWPVHVGLARGYAAVGDNQKALEHAKLAVAQAPDPVNKKNLEAMVQSLSEGKPIAQ